MLTDNGLSYSKSRGEAPIHCIPVADMLAVERVDESAFSMKFVSAAFFKCCVVIAIGNNYWTFLHR